MNCSKLTTTFRRARSDERGLALVHIGIALLALMAMSALSIDFGVLWLARTQAQTAADAGALAGATALAFDNYDDRTNSGPAHQAALTTASANKVAGVAATVVVQQDKDANTWSNPGAPSACTPAVANGSCIQTSVYRDGSNGSTTLPTYFARLVGVNSQNVKATATAQLLSASGSKCLKPWMAPDKSDDPNVTYGLSDVGTFLVLRQKTGPSQYQQADYAFSGATCQGGGGACYGWAIQNCVGGPGSDPAFDIGDQVYNKPGNTAGKQDANKIIAQDPGATWNQSTKSVDNSCALTNSCGCANAQGDGCANGMNGTISPRIVPVAVYRPTDLLQGSGRWSAPIKNIVGMFLLPPGIGDPTNANNAPCVADPENVCGYLTTVPGAPGNVGPVPGKSLNVFISLVR